MTHFPRFSLLALPLLAILAASCGDMVPVWVGEAKLEDYTLYHTDTPCAFAVDIPSTPDATQPLTLELEITYYASGIGRSDLPLYLALENTATKEVKEFKTNIPLNIDGNWLGILEENSVDYTLTHIAVPAVKLAPGKYSLKIFTDDKRVEKIVGVVKITARLYKQGEQKTV